MRQLTADAILIARDDRSLCEETEPNIYDGISECILVWELNIQDGIE